MIADPGKMRPVLDRLWTSPYNRRFNHMFALKTANPKKHLSVLMTVVLAMSSAFSSFVVNVPVAEAAGSPAWTSGGVILAATTNASLSGDQSASSTNEVSIAHAATSDGNYVYLWQDDANALRAQKLNSAGTPQWGANGAVVYNSATETLSGGEESLVADSVGGVIAVFHTTGGAYTQIRAQRLTSAGNYIWAHAGAVVFGDGKSAGGNASIISDDGVTVSPQTILNSTGDPLATGRAQIAVNAAISNVTNAHNDYSDTLKFIATGTF